MGPHSFKCGKKAWQASSSPRSSALQWGRTLSSAENLVAALESIPADVASMGPHSFKCGKLYQEKRHSFFAKRFNGAALFQVRKKMAQAVGAAAAKRLQWGRTLSSAEKAASARRTTARLPASMGPHSFKCGKLPASISQRRIG